MPFTLDPVDHDHLRLLAVQLRRRRLDDAVVEAILLDLAEQAQGLDQPLREVHGQAKEFAERHPKGHTRHRGGVLTRMLSVGVLIVWAGGTLWAYAALDNPPYGPAAFAALVAFLLLVGVAALGVRIDSRLPDGIERGEGEESSGGPTFPGPYIGDSWG